MSNFEGYDLILVAYKKESVVEGKRKRKMRKSIEALYIFLGLNVSTD